MFLPWGPKLAHVGSFFALFSLLGRSWALLARPERFFRVSRPIFSELGSISGRFGRVLGWFLHGFFAFVPKIPIWLKIA